MQGGLSAGRERTNNCYAVNDLSLVSFNTGTVFTAGTPRLSDFCDTRPPFQPNVKALAVYPLPWWGLQTSRDLSGPARSADSGDRHDSQREHRPVVRPQPVGVPGHRRLHRDRRGQPDCSWHACSAIDCRKSISGCRRR